MSIKLIIHPGHFKCGSTSIQNFLSNNRKNIENQKIALVNQHLGIGDPENSKWEFPWRYFKNIIFVNSSLGDFEEKLLKLKSEAENSNYHSILISDEMLSDIRTLNGTVNVHEKINEVFDDISLIYYIRRQDDVMLSAWQQWGHKRGLTLMENTNDLINSKRVDFLTIIDRFREIYGDSRIQVSLLNKEVLKNGDLIFDFLSRAGIDNEVEYIKNDENANVGINASYCDILQKISGFYINDTDNSIRKTLHKYGKNSKDLIFNKNRNLDFFKICNEIMDHFIIQNKELHRRYFNNYNFNKLFGKIENLQELFIQKRKKQIEDVKDILAIQNDLIFSLIRKVEHLENQIYVLSNISFSNKIIRKFKNIFK